MGNERSGLPLKGDRGVEPVVAMMTVQVGPWQGST